MLITLCDQLGLEIIYSVDNVFADSHIDDAFEVGNNLYEITTPVIMVMGVASFTQKFDIQLYLRKALLNKGFKVSQVGTKSICELMGFYSIPPWFFHGKYTESEKVYAFNNFVHLIEKQESPDIIIIGIPDGIIPLNRKHSYNFGIPAYLINNAIRADFTILSLFNGSYNDEFYAEMNSMCNYKFNVDIDSFFISNFAPISNSLDQSELVYGYTKENANDSLDYKIFDSSGFEDACFIDYIINRLVMYDNFGVI